MIACRRGARAGSRSLRYLMKPEALSLANHHEPVPRFQFKRDCFLCLPVTELKPSCSPERQAGNRRTIAKADFVVTVPSDAVATMPIKVHQNSIERGARKRFGTFTQTLNYCRKWSRLMNDAAVGVGRVAEPSRHSRDRLEPLDSSGSCHRAKAAAFH